MAKWGEGDPRWIVEERPDATNVNNWHWTEKNADAWSKAKLKELFGNLVIDDPNAMVVIEEVEKCEGEARINNRKGKLIVFYEWDMALKWKGNLNGNDNEVKGKIEIPNLSEEHTDMKDVDVEVSVTTKGTESTVLKEFMRKGAGAVQIRKQLAAYVEALKSEFSSGLILPKKGTENAVKSPPPTTAKAANLATATSAAESGMKAVQIGGGNGVKLDLDDIKMEETMKCTGQELFNALTQRDMIQIFTGGPAKMAEEAGKDEKFELLGGNVTGKYIEVVPFTKIVQEWRLRSWPSGHFSQVEILIKQTKEDTKLTITQKGVPRKEVEATKQGWHRYYFESMKRSFGFGAMLF